MFVQTVAFNYILAQKNFIELSPASLVRYSDIKMLTRLQLFTSFIESHLSNTLVGLIFTYSLEGFDYQFL